MVTDRSVFWEGKRVLITGHTGFKGGWLSLWLQALGAEVTGYALGPPTQPSLFERARIAEGMTSVNGDVRDLARLHAVMQKHRPEIVFHLAAQAIVRDAYQNPVDTYSTNVMGTVHALEAARHVDSVRVVVAITSDKCYENKKWVWGYRETDELGGHDPYSSSKGCAEIVISSYRRSFFSEDTAQPGMLVASARAGNVIGGGDWAPDRLVPDIVRAFQAGRPVRIRNPKSTRPWQHVLTPLDGYLTLAEHLWKGEGRFAEGWNFGPGEHDAKPVAWIVERMKTLWGEGASWGRDEDDHPHEAMYLHLDCSKAKRQLGWRSRLPIEKTLEWIVEWYRQAQQRDADMRAFTEAQITRYERLAHGGGDTEMHERRVPLEA